MGHKFLSPTDKRNIEDAAKKALCVFGLNYGAVDIMLSKDNNNPYVLEINSTPCLTDENSNTAEVYARSLARIINAKV
jgi:glutathione synthase/RimK-type ligase-like ATP-grasp enzyme